MKMDGFSGIKRDEKTGDATLRCKIDGTDQELTIPVDVLARFAWATWAEHATPSNIVRTTVAVPAQSLKWAVGQENFYLILQLSGGWDIPIELRSQHLPQMRGAVQQMELQFGGSARA